MPLPAGRTQLEGTTWCEQPLEPAIYWKTWTDWLVPAIHRRVLAHGPTKAPASTRAD